MCSNDSEDEGKGERIKMKDNAVNDVAEECAALEEIARMDAVLRSKQMEKEEATVKRNRMEKDSLSLLTNLVKSDIPDAFKTNIQAFLKFISDSDSCEDTVVRKEEREKYVALDDGYEYGVDSSKKKKKSPEDIDRIKKIDRVGKNIQLAKCGQGVLSVTDQERERIDRLLQDAEFVDFSPDEAAPAKVVLENINDRIQVLQKKSGKEPADAGAPSERKERKLGESGLKQIDATLEKLRSGTKREVHPLSDEQMEALIKEATAEIPRPDMPPETLARLVDKTKKSIPKFMYKWPENDPEVT